jgi:hypothetical protein
MADVTGAKVILAALGAHVVRLWMGEAKAG